MKIIKISDDLVPLSRRQHTALAITIACIFQFLLFFVPALAAEAAPVDNNNRVSVDTMVKGEVDPTVAALIAQQTHQSEAKEQTALPAPSPEKKVEEKKEVKKKEVKVLGSSTRVITAYNSDPAQTDDTPCITANGFDVCQHGQEDTIAANFLRFGTKVRIPELYGDRIFVVRDRMNQRYNNRVDIWMKEKSDAKQFGVKVARIEVVSELD